MRLHVKPAATNLWQAHFMFIFIGIFGYTADLVDILPLATI